ncbi:hypothetical protein DXG01_000538, partial [Tephrocybe rancida]
YHQRLYTLDRQVDYARDEIVEGLGTWLLRRSQHALKKRKAAELILQGCQSKKAGKDAVNELIRLRETQNDLKKRVKEYDAIIANVDSPPDEYADARTELESVCKKLEELRTRIRRKQAVLDQRINEHTASSVNRRDPSISKLALNYNHLRDEMETLIKARKAPPRTLCPEKIEMKGLFALDVDDAIWQDVGLDEGSNEAPPPWLANESVRAGIRALLERDRCTEEEHRLRHECRSMRVWLSEEWRIVNLALATDDESLQYHLGLRRAALCRLCALWRKCVDSLDFGNVATLPPWGPSDEDLCSARIAQQTELVQDNRLAPMLQTGCARQAESDLEESDDNLEIDDSDFEGDEEIVLIDTLDAVDLADAFRSTNAQDNDYSSDM